MRSTWLSGGFRPHILDSALPSSSPGAPAGPAAPAPAPYSSQVFEGSGIQPASGGSPSERLAHITIGRGERVDLSRLPEKARAKLLRLQGTHDDLMVIRRDLGEKIARSGEAKREAQARLEQARTVTSRSGVRRPMTDHELFATPGAQAAIDRAQREVDAALAEAVELSDRSARLASRQSPLLNRILEWVAELPRDSVVEEYSVPPPALLAGQTVVDAISERRDKLASLRADIHELDSRPVPSKIVKAAIARQVADFAERGRPNTMLPVEVPGRGVKFATLATPLPGGMSETEDAFGLFCWVFGKELVERLCRDVDEVSDDDLALDETERSRRIAAVLAEIAAVEYGEEALVELAESQGMDIARRPEASPAAVLGVIISEARSCPCRSSST